MLEYQDRYDNSKASINKGQVTRLGSSAVLAGPLITVPDGEKREP
jgi:hypothetical protein